MNKKFFQGKTILLISPESWDHLFVSKHHYAIELAHHNTVFFLNPPTDRYRVGKTRYDNLWQINYKPFPRGLRFLPSFLKRFFLRSKFEKLQRITSVKFDCVWSFDNSVFFDFSCLPSEVFTISHIVDYSQNFQFSYAAATAAVCFGVSQNIVDKLKIFNENAFLIPHGTSWNQNSKEGVRLPGSNSIKALYAGNLDSKYIDKSLLCSLIMNHTNVDFIFFGKGGKDLTRGPNTYYPGVVDHRDLPAYLAQGDVLLLAYHTDKYPDQLTNAHKVLDYLNTGVVTVSTFLSDYQNKPNLLEMASTQEDFNKIFGKVISELPYYNSPAKVSLRKNHAANNTYHIRLTEIEEIVSEIYHEFQSSN